MWEMIDPKMKLFMNVQESYYNNYFSSENHNEGLYPKEIVKWGKSPRW